MAKQATGQRIRRAPLSAIIQNDRLRALFERAERDQNPDAPLATVILPAPPPLPLDGAAAIDLSAKQRKRVEERIQWALDLAELLTAVLDAAEPDADLEPSLGWTISGNRGGTDDREEQNEDGSDEDGGSFRASPNRLPPITSRDLHRAEPQRVTVRALDAHGRPLPPVETTMFVITAREDVR
jgi:hypothetical protein